ncbi:cobaltochelatase subunit CobN [Oceanicella actignis]|uniref:Cobaltochelatase subunit CobN n=1 Tax=Oceanicella actignis TaxID=1189325 RepID=A0A1M7SP72_9RHOB|nr:cobaltochelatase subunit CobN [Oceanicella actignis]SES65068.1 cobaltochelatase CobN subunit [Oceanicella actignis]SHN60206.1 cobaltochelatase CobN [Oceanicella actignis]
MHLLLAQPGEVSDGSEAVDLGQDPGDIVIISAADTELAALSEARAQAIPGLRLRLASLLHLQHPMSADLHLDRTAARSRLVVVRALGGKGYWSYGLEQYALRLREAGALFAALPGDDKPDEELRRLSTVAPEDWDRLWAYFVEGGPRNMANLLRHCAHMLGEAEAPPAPAPLLRAGVYWPGAGVADLDAARAAWRPGAPVAALVFYRALVQGAGLHPVNRLTKALAAQGLNPLPIFVASLKDPVSAATLETLFAEAPPDVVVNATSFAVSSPQAGAHEGTPLDRPGAPVLQAIFAGGTEQAWEAGANGLSARDIAMNVALPEVDGRIVTRAVSFKGEAYFDEQAQAPIAAYRAQGDRVDFVARLAAAWARLRALPNGRKRVALILANYPNRDGRLANGVGLDAPASTVAALRALAEAGYDVADAPADSAELMARIMAGPTNWLPDRAARQGGQTLTLSAYLRACQALPYELRQQVEERWGPPEGDPFFLPEGNGLEGRFALSIHRFGSVAVGVQPARGYNIDPKQTYHAPDLVPPHNYLAFHFWLRDEFGAHAFVHMGKHGNLEWLPGKSVALSRQCFPEAALGPIPNLYPFIVNDPGEGAQAKRRAAAVVIDHLTPPMTRAETYGPLKDLEALVDEYYEASGVDARRAAHLRREIMTLTAAAGLDADAGIAPDMPEDEALARLDEYLCDIKESQIRDGLHVFGAAPEGVQERDLLVALARVPRAAAARPAPGDASLIRAIAQDLGLDPAEFDPLDCAMAAPWRGPRPEPLARILPGPWRTNGDAVERIEALAAALVDGAPLPEGMERTRAVLDWIEGVMRPALRASGPAEMRALLDGLAGRFVPPGPSGAPTRGRPDVLPTGRNFYSVDSRAVPTPAAWTLGWRSAQALVERHAQEEGDWPRALLLTAWGTSNMRTGGDDVAQAMALIGARPTWDAASRRVTGFEILPLSALGRPRVDVTLRVSGFFRDAFPAQIELFDSAARAVMALDEPEHDNPLAARFRAERARLRAEGASEGEAELRAGYRVFGSKPGAYGAGLQALIDERLWDRREDLADSYLEWGGYAYGRQAEGARARDLFEARLARADAVVQNQDNREHDLLDSDDYYQFEGGAAAAVAHLSGREPRIWHNDHSRPERPVVRSLDEEIGRVVRARVVNPKWIAGVKRHGYKGAFEIAATVDYLFAFAATTRAVRSHHFDLVEQAFLADDDTRAFIAQANPAALREIAQRLAEAQDRGLWRPRSNSARARIEAIIAAQPQAQGGEPAPTERRREP